MGRQRRYRQRASLSAVQERVSLNLEPTYVSLTAGGSPATVTVNLTPPRRENVHSGDYQLVIRATSRDDPSATAAAAMIMRITPTGGFQFQMLKARDVGQEGSFSLR